MLQETMRRLVHIDLNENVMKKPQNRGRPFTGEMVFASKTYTYV